MGVRKWTCPNCGKTHEDMHDFCTGIGGCGAAYIGAEFANLKGQRCPKCNYEEYAAANFCFKCGTPLRGNRLANASEPLAAEGPEPIRCHVFNHESMVVCAPDSNAERVYAVGAGNVLPLIKDLGKWRQVWLPAGESGYADSSSGCLADVAVEAVKSPLGFVRIPPDFLQGFRLEERLLTVQVPQPDGDPVVIHTLEKDDRIPIVAEFADYYVVQLASGLRGHLAKTSVVRTLTPDSLQKQESGSFLGTLFGAALLIGLGAANHSYQKNLIAEGVAQGIRDA